MTPGPFFRKNEKKDTVKERQRFGGGGTLKPVGVPNSYMGEFHWAWCEMISLKWQFAFCNH